MKKNLKVVKIDKNKKEIVLDNKKTSHIHIFKKNNTHIIPLLFLISLLFLLTSGIIFLKNMKSNDKPNYKFVSIDTTLKDNDEIILGSNAPITDETAKNMFFKKSNFKIEGTTFLQSEYKEENYTIKFYSDGTAIKIVKGNIITRVSSLQNGNYGIDKNGTIKKGAHIKDVSIVSKDKYPWGNVTYYSDDSAEIESKNGNLFVRNSKDIKDEFVSNNKISYLKDTKIKSKYKINYYYDGTIEIIDGKKNYLVRNINDIEILENDIVFPNNNQSTIYKNVTLDDGKIISYYEDGGAIIKKNGVQISVRKSNSIKIINNKLIEIVDDIYVEESNKKGNVIFYTNGGASFIFENKKYYIDENSNLLFKDDQFSINGKYEYLTREANKEKETFEIYEKKAIVRKDTTIAIVPKESILFDKFGKIIELTNKEENKNTSFAITNNTNKLLKYRVVIEESKKTNLDSKYIKYQMQIKEKYIAPEKLNNNIWKINAMSNDLNMKGKNYILTESTIESGDTIDVSMMLWADYDTIPNSMQNKDFYGTIKVYAWLDK